MFARGAIFAGTAEIPLAQDPIAAAQTAEPCH
jgi:hypothetical protein